MTKTVLGKLLRLQRKRLRLTQAQVASRVGISTRTYQRLEGGARMDLYDKAFDVLELRVIVIPKDSVV